MSTPAPQVHPILFYMASQGGRGTKELAVTFQRGHQFSSARPRVSLHHDPLYSIILSYYE